MLRNSPIKFSAKIWGLMIIMVVSATFLTSFIGYRVASDALDEKGETILMNAVDMAIEILQLQEEDVLEGELTLEAAQEAAKNLFRKNAGIDLGESGYFVIMDGHALILVHPTIEGTDGSTLQDMSKDRIPFATMAVEIAKDGGGFVKYDWFFSDSDKVDEKILYTKYFEPWDWVVMATAYKGEFNKSAAVLLNTFFNVVLLSVILISVIVRLIILDTLKSMDSTIQTMRDLEQSRFEKIEELEAANREVQALYEEMLASEEMLQYNYDELERYKKALEEEKDNYRRILIASNEAYWQYNGDRDEVTIANFTKDLLEATLSLENFIGYIHEEDKASVRAYITHSDPSVNSVFESRIRVLVDEANHVYHWFQLLGIAQDGKLFGAMTDINTEIVNRERIEFYAFHDPVLGLYNMDYLNDLITNTMVKGQLDCQYALIVVGVVGYPRILDAYGKNLTDILSFQLSAEISAIFKDAAYISSLHSGRFAVWIKCDDMETCVKKAIEQLSDEILAHVGQFENIKMPVKIAYGATLVNRVHNISATVIAEAEMAFDHAVTLGQYNEIKWYDDSLQVAKDRTMMIEQQLLGAREKNELSVVYQPQYLSLESMEVIGYEALLRWHNSYLGIVAPNEFIPLAEAIDQINPLGRFVIDEVTDFLEIKMKQGEYLNVSINASYKELLQNDYVAYLIESVDRKGISRSQINVEITESTISEYLDIVSESLSALRNQDFEIQMDDFGTGYSSLYQLGRMPIQVLKIDKIFIWALDSDAKMHALTKLIIDVAHRMDIKIIAEGVETLQQYEILKGMGCDYYQGYLFSRPLTADEI